MNTSLPYHEPGIVTILIQTSFIFILNIVNSILDHTLYCGLLGQVLVGIAWGTPGANWISIHTEEVVVQLGYIGLILLVYEGGLSTSFKSLKANFLLSIAVAITGITLPIALSFSLQGLAGASPLQAFAAGAALCSTSLGTTFTILSTSGLAATRLGVVLSSAAMMDDIVGLVMVQVISNLGGSATTIAPATIIRPILVSLAFAAIVPFACRFVVRPATLLCNQHRECHPAGMTQRVLCLKHTAFIIHSAVLLALVTGASYAGTSNLFAAYIAGAVVSWWDDELPHPSHGGRTKIAADPAPRENQTTLLEPTMLQQRTQQSTPAQPLQLTTGAQIYAAYFYQPVARVLKPFFFASIGFSIPISRLFASRILWRGIVYTIIMTIAKMVCGLWLVRIPWSAFVPSKLRAFKLKSKFPSLPHLWGKREKTTTPPAASTPVAQSPQRATSPSVPPTPPKPLSLYPPAILSLAMVARGEIGFLVSALAESKGVFSPTSLPQDYPTDIFLITTLAIFLCTLVSPLCVGLLVRRVKRLEGRRERGATSVLGVWGVE
ncbi:Sodium/hydrogen exchanger [Mytilinidion resinicola]|uniref:Sodium/hydrogen exchanger n=1 Tax=Mytilinidion resinicola TaxID=574789 RepID=A0A6A6YSG0_9PEZI|nr:Sodium/hydrogen exchanger [Mytilinidion resinicola]KAF2811439.1 Sodium/hydrogen exchanger [Mytilinidion resinicola]